MSSVLDAVGEDQCTLLPAVEFGLPNIVDSDTDSMVAMAEPRNRIPSACRHDGQRVVARVGARRVRRVHEHRQRRPSSRSFSDGPVDEFGVARYTSQASRDGRAIAAPVLGLAAASAGAWISARNGLIVGVVCAADVAVVEVEFRSGRAPAWTPQPERPQCRQ